MLQSILVTAFAATVLAQAAPKSAPQQAPAPRSASEADIDAWEKQYVDKREYARFDVYDDSIVYLYLDGRQDLTKPVVRTWVRYELFKPEDYDGLTVRSYVGLYDFDCDAKRARNLAFDFYPELDMGGEAHSVNDQNPEWKYPRMDDPLEDQLAFICESKTKPEEPAAQPSPPLPPRGAPPASTSEADIERWIAANVEIGGGYVLEYIPRGVVLIYMTPPNGDKPVTVKARFEYFLPTEVEGALFRSSRLTYEADCRKNQIRVQGAEYFTDQNLRGVVKTQAFDNTWAKPPMGFDKQVALVCREMREPGYAMSVRKSIQPTDDAPEGGGPRLMPKRR